jgi:hypothetical protein
MLVTKPNISGLKVLCLRTKAPMPMVKMTTEDIMSKTSHGTLHKNTSCLSVTSAVVGRREVAGQVGIDVGDRDGIRTVEGQVSGQITKVSRGLDSELIKGVQY